MECTLFIGLKLPSLGDEISNNYLQPIYGEVKEETFISPLLPLGQF